MQTRMRSARVNKSAETSIPLTENARTVLSKRYLRKGPDGEAIETVEEMFRRVAHHVALAEAEWNGDVAAAEEDFYALLTQLRFFPNSPTFTGAGTPLGQLAACFVIPVSDDMGRDESGIFQTLRDAALIQQTGGGNGFSFSRLRPKGALVASSAGQATGPVGFMRVYDKAFDEIKQGGVRRGANMGVLRVDHPDIFDFIKCKTSEDAITNFNISVGVSDEFMLAVEADADFDLVAPHDGEVWRTVKAREIFDEIVKQAHHNGEPGVLFLDTANRDNPLPHLYALEATNPCVTGDTLIATENRPVSIEELANQRANVKVWSWNFEKERFELQPMVNIRQTRRDERIVGISLDYGGDGTKRRTLRVTRDHHFFTIDGHKIKAEELKEGDQLLACEVLWYLSFMAGPVEDGGPLLNVGEYEKIKTPRLNRSCCLVVKVADAGTADVYNGMVEGTHNYVIVGEDNAHSMGVVSANCGEQWLGPYENCCLGSINLARHVTEIEGQPAVDWEKLGETVVTATRFLDDVVTINSYVPAVPQLEASARRARRIGLGIMGLGDMMYHVGVRYGSETAQEFAAQVMEFVRYHAMRTSVELARERGPFPAITGSIYDPLNLRWTPPEPIRPYSRDFGRPEIHWERIVAGMREFGIRNAAQTTVAPTGTIATVAGCEGYGCEPVFALAYVRHVNDDGQDLELAYTSPLFEKALIEAGLDPDVRERIVNQVSLAGSCQGIEEVPEHIRHTFVVAMDITAEEHVRMQAALQVFVDNSISKTCNFPATATEQDVADAYLMAWKLGCKGLTVYVTGSREKVVLETKKTRLGKDGKAEQPSLFPEPKKPRPRMLRGETYRIGTPMGTTFVTVNVNGDDEPFEVFLHTSKAGSETAAVAEAIGRLLSYILRLSSPVPPKERMAETVRQLGGIGGGRPLGFGAQRVLSLPDAVAQVLAEYLGQASASDNGRFRGTEQLTFKIGDLCPECGEAALVREEGCRKCYACGYSEC